MATLIWRSVPLRVARKDCANRMSVSPVMEELTGGGHVYAGLGWRFRARAGGEECAVSIAPRINAAPRVRAVRRVPAGRLVSSPRAPVMLASATARERWRRPAARQDGHHR